MFDLLTADSYSKRLEELGKFIDYWYGKHRPSYGFSKLPGGLPTSLKRFYERDGRRPPLNGIDSEYFYEGACGHHLFQPSNLGLRSKKNVKFFMEYEGDFDGVTERGRRDPVVSLTGHLPAREFDPDNYGLNTWSGTVSLESKLSEFLVSHVLMTTIYERQNNYKMASESHPIYKKFRSAKSRKKLVWTLGDWSPNHCTQYLGNIHLFGNDILVHEFGGAACLAARKLDAGKFAGISK